MPKNFIDVTKLGKRVPTAGLGKARGQSHHDFVTIKTEDIGISEGVER